MNDLKTVSINEMEQIFLDGEPIENVVKYTLEHSAGEAAELTVTIAVKVGRVAFESEQ